MWAIIAMALLLACGPPAYSKTLFAAFDTSGAVTRTAEVDADDAAVPQDGSCLGCIVIALDDPRLAAFRAKQIAPPTTVSAAAFQARFTDAQQAAVWAAAATDTTGMIGAGLTKGLTAQAIDLTDPKVAVWVGLLVSAGALTKAQGANILDPNFTAPQ